MLYIGLKFYLHSVIGDDRRPCEGPQQHEMEDISFLSEQSVQPRQFQLAQPYAGSGQDPVEDSYHSVEREVNILHGDLVG